MSDPSVAPENPADAARHSAQFAGLVLQVTNMAFMFLGQVPHPESGKPVTDLETAQAFIGQLEMLEAKTQGNLTPQEQGLLKQSLTAVRMAFVQAVEHPAPTDAGSQPAPTPPSDGPAPTASPPAAESAATAEPTGAESPKKFTKKY